MKKITWFIVLAVLFLISTASVVLGSGYWSTGGCNACHFDTHSQQRYVRFPHARYSATSFKCKVCHAVHLSTGTYKLTRASSATDACNFCHAFGGAHASALNYSNNAPLPKGMKSLGCAYCHVGGADPYEEPWYVLYYRPASHYRGIYDRAPNMDPELATIGHTIGEVFTSIPDGPSISMTLYCTSCHSVHGAQCINFASYGGITQQKILKNDPLATGTPIPDTSTTYATAYATRVAFCQACHTENAGYASHPIQAPDGGSSWSATVLCSSCHNAVGQPHTASSGYRMLTGRDTTATVQASNLDDNCRRCHLNGDSTAGVGITF